MCAMNPRTLRPSATFNPRQISGLALWVDGNDSSTFTFNDSTISEWRDKSGNQRHFTQGTALRQPSVTAAAKNGKSAVAFTNDFLTGVYTYNVGSIFCVWEQPTTVAGDNNAAILGARTFNSTKVPAGSLDHLMIVTKAFNPPNTLAIFSNQDPSSYRLNGAVPNTAEFTNFALGATIRTSPDRWNHVSATFSPVSGSKTFVMGADPFTANSRLMQDGHIAEFLCYSTQLSASEVLTVEKYLIAKWGLQ